MSPREPLPVHERPLIEHALQRRAFAREQRIVRLLREQLLKPFRHCKLFIRHFNGDPVIIFLLAEIVAGRDIALRIRHKAAQRCERTVRLALRPVFLDLRKRILPLFGHDALPFPDEAQRRLFDHRDFFHFRALCGHALFGVLL